MSYNKKLGRISVEVSDSGLRDHSYGHGVKVSCLAGWNDGCRTLDHTMSVDELIDMRFLVDRAIEAAMQGVSR